MSDPSPEYVAWLARRGRLELDETAGRRELVFEVIIPGEPVPKARGRTFQTKTKAGKPITRTITPDRTKAWEKHAKSVVMFEWQRRPALDCCVEVDICAVFDRPKRLALFSSQRLPYAHDPDKDNIEKAVYDALTKAGVWVDDCRITDGSTRKRYAAVGESAHVHVLVFKLEAVW